MKKEPIKINLSTAIISIFVVIVFVGAGYLFNENNKALIQKAKNEEKLKVLQNKVEQLENANKEKNENNTILNSTDTTEDKYKEITKKLNDEDVLEVTDAIKNSDGTYTLKGKISVVDTSKEQEAEYSPRKYSGEYMQITVSGDTKCVYSVDSYEEKTSTVEKVFSKKLAFGNCFNFEFKNGKCISVYEVVIGH